MGKTLSHPPRVFRVNWFRRDEEGRFLWPGFGQNMRVLQWILERCEGAGKAMETPIGWIPGPGGIETAGLDLAPGTLEKLFALDIDGWRGALRSQEEFFASFGDRLPAAIREEHGALGKRLQQAHLSSAVR